MAFWRSTRFRVALSFVGSAVVGARMAQRGDGASELRKTIVTNGAATLGTVVGYALARRSRSG